MEKFLEKIKIRQSYTLFPSGVELNLDDLSGNGKIYPKTEKRSM